MTMKIDWRDGNPVLEGNYLVAVALGENSGYYAQAYWTGTEWHSTGPRNIIAHYPIMDVIDALNLAWPDWHAAAHENLPPLPTPPDAEDWEEVQ